MTMRLTTYLPLVSVLGLAGCGDDTTSTDTSDGSTSNADTGATSTPTTTSTPTSAGTDAMTSSSGGADSSSSGAGSSSDGADSSSDGGTTDGTSTTSGATDSGSSGDSDSGSTGAAMMCGNGVAEIGEECDDQDFGGETCMTQGFGGGDLTCTAGCMLDLSLCANATLDLGDPDCMADAECTTGVCWDFADYDPFCGGSVCSTNCVNDIQCQNQFAAAGAPFPMSATCGADGRCNPIGTGFGLFFCA